MSEKKALSNEELDKVSGGRFKISNPKGYWYLVSGNGSPYRYLDEKYGFATETERDSAMANSVEYAQTHGITDIHTNKGYIS